MPIGRMTHFIPWKVSYPQLTPLKNKDMTTKRKEKTKGRRKKKKKGR